MPDIGGMVLGNSAQYYDFFISWSEGAPDIANNRSQVTATLYFRRNSDALYFDNRAYNLNYNAVASISINGTTVFNSSSIGFDTRYNTNLIVLGSGSIWVTHNPDGSKHDMNISGSFVSNTGTEGLTGGSVSGNVNLADIPRASVIGTIQAFNFEDSFSVPITKYYSGFTDNLTIKIGSTTVATRNNYTNNTAINLTDDELLTAYNALGGDMSATVTFNLVTMSGATQIGTSSGTATGTAAGTAYVKVGGVWKRAVPHVKVSGAWKKAIMLVKDMTWKRGKN